MTRTTHARPSNHGARAVRVLAPAAALALVAAGVQLGLQPASAAPAQVPTVFGRDTAGAFSGRVPDGVCKVQVTARGGAGGSVVTGVANTNGAGADISATYPVVPGQVFSGYVGGGGQPSTGTTSEAGAGGPTAGAGGAGDPVGGAGSGGRGGTVATGHAGAGGGGRTVVSIAGVELVVAGGGGGGAGGHATNGGFGGNAGVPTTFGQVTAGVNGSDGFDIQDGTVAAGGGRGGQPGGPGAGGENAATANLNGSAGATNGSGGNGGRDENFDSAGGGGGGFTGGGGGASTRYQGSGNPVAGGNSGGGGGGGSSVIRNIAPGGLPGGASGLSAKAGPRLGTSHQGAGANGLVELDWIGCDYDLDVTKTATIDLRTGLATWTVTITNDGPDNMSRGDLVTLTDTLPGPANTEITRLDLPAGLTCNAEVGDPMASPLTCSRPYDMSGFGGAGDGRRGLAVEESITLTYTQTFTANGDYQNTASVTDRSNNSPANNTADHTVEYQVDPPAAQPGTTSGPQGATQSWEPDASAGTFPLDWDTLTLLDADGDPAGSVTIPGQGTYTAHPDNERIVFTPVPEFSGTADPVDYRISDDEGQHATSTYTPTVTPVAVPDTTRGPQGLLQTVDPLANDTENADVILDPETLRLVDPITGDDADSVTTPRQGTWTVADGKIRFKPQPQFTGTATTVRYRADDEDGNTVGSTHTPTVYGVTPTAEDGTTTGPQGVPQSWEPVAHPGDVESGDPEAPLDWDSLTLLDSDGDPTSSVTVPNQGTYTINADEQAIVFTPRPGFTGTADTVDYQIADVNGSTADASYTPTTTPVVPTADPDESEGSQGAPQQVNPFGNDEAGNGEVPLDEDSLTLLDGDGNPVTELVVPGQGTFTVDGRNAIFTPEPQFIGRADPVDYRIADVNGTTATSTYTPTVTPVAVPDTTSGPQGLSQTVEPLANDTKDADVVLDPATLKLVAPITGVGVDSVTTPGQGTWTVADGTIRFQPVPQFTGTATSVGYRADDEDGNTVGSTYTATVTPVNPGANPDVTSGPQGSPQVIDPLDNDLPGNPGVPLDPRSLTLLDRDGDSVTSVTIPRQGTYTVDGATRTIVFSPVPQFVGTANPVDYRVADVNGTPTESTYTPTTTAVTPTAKPDTSTGLLNTPQSINPLANDAPGSPVVPLDPRSLTLLDRDGDPVASVTIPQQGTYTVKDGTIVFTPMTGYLGTADPVDYRITDVNGTPTQSTYTPTVVAPPALSQNEEQTHRAGTPVTFDMTKEVPGLDPSTLFILDSAGRPVTRLEAPGEGTWTVDQKTGKIVFTPESGFEGDPTPVTWVGKLADGTPYDGTLRIAYQKAPAEAKGEGDKEKAEPKRADDGVLPDAGGPSLWLAVLGLGLLAGGAGVLSTTRRRGRQSA